MKPQIVAGIAVFEGVILLLLFVGWQLNQAFGGSSFFGGCDGTVYSSAKSPDGKLVATAFERDCGATTDFASFVVIQDADKKLDLSAPLERNDIVFQSDGDYHPTLKWKSNNLQISFPPGAAPSEKEIAFQVVNTGEVRIEYQGLKR